MKLLFTLTLFLLPYAAFTQPPYEIDWGKAQQQHRWEVPAGSFPLTLRTGMTSDSLEAILEKTMVIRFERNGSSGYRQVAEFNESLRKHIKKGTKLDEEITRKKQVTKEDFYAALAIKPGDSLTIIPYVGNGKMGAPQIFIFSGKAEVTDEDGNPTPVCFTPSANDSVFRKYIDTLHRRYTTLEKDTSFDCRKKFPGDRIVYDFREKYFYSEKDATKTPINLARKKLLFNDMLHLKIDNINRYLYRVDIEGTDIDFNSDMPPLLKNFFIGDTSSTLGILMRKKGTSLSGGGVARDGSGTSCLTETTWRIRELQHGVHRYNQMMNYLKVERMKAFGNCFKFNCCASDENKFGKMYGILLDALETIKAQAEELQLYLVSKDAGEENIDSIKKIVSDFQKRLPSEQLLSDLALFVQNITKSNGEFLTPPMSVKGNRFELSIRIQPWDTVGYKPTDTVRNFGPLNTEEIYLDFPVLLKPFVSFSSGSFIAFNRHLQEITYEWQKVPGSNNMIGDSSRYRLGQTGYSPLPVGFAAFANIETKVQPSIGLGFSAGVGLTIEKDPRLAYLAGGTLFLGDLHQLGITVGFAGMQVDRLKENLKVYYDQEVLATNSSKPSIEYYKEFKVGGFISLTYTPFKVNRRPVYTANVKAKKAKEAGTNP